jgi:hypothetical protein
MGEKGDQNQTTDAVSPEPNKESNEYIAGFKLLGVMASVTITAFLLFLDQSILGTVSAYCDQVALTSD